MVSGIGNSPAITFRLSVPDFARLVAEQADPQELLFSGRFDVEGQWNVDAFPVDRGIRHPARLTGRTDGHTLTFAVRLSDTGQALGPALVTLGKEPRMQNCPICRR